MYGNQFQPNTGDAALDDALRELARVFGNTRGDPGWVDGLSIGDSSATLSKPCWNLTQAEYLDFGTHSVCTDDAKDLRHAVRYFLPRVALDLTRGNWWIADTPWEGSHLVSLLLRTSWKSWPVAESNAVRQWLENWLRYAMENSSQSTRHVGEVTMLANQAGICVPTVFEEVIKSNPDAALAWLADQVVDNQVSLLKTGWPTDWGECWGTPIRDHQSAVEFILLLISDSTVARLESAFFAATDPEKQQLFSYACENISHVRRFGVTQAGLLAEALASPLLKA